MTTMINPRLDANGDYADAVEIYQLTAPNGKVYIGQACLYRRSGRKGWLNKGMAGRWREHQYEAGRGKSDSGCRMLYNSIRKYGGDTFKTEVLLRVSKHLADQYEQNFIKMLGTLVPEGLNLTEGGYTSRYSLESRQKMSASARERKASAATKATLSRVRREKAALSGLPALISRLSESGKSHSGAGFRAAIRHEGKRHAKAFVSIYFTMPAKLRMAVEARDQILKDLGLPPITDDPVTVN